MTLHTLHTLHSRRKLLRHNELMCVGLYVGSRITLHTPFINLDSTSVDLMDCGILATG